MIRSLIVFLMLSLLLMTGPVPRSQAAAPVTITMKVTAQGLLVSGIPMENKRMTVPRGTRVRLVLNYADTNHNAHKFTLTAKDTEVTSPVMDGEARKTATIEFTAGDRGQEFYRLSC
ncbi:MAG TPA: hypothetical protein VFG71_13685, partial [Nitrospiraceae bacterium]|nr:hypothetical protein [Nitrospiraceae bacterium]